MSERVSGAKVKGIIVDSLGVTLESVTESARIREDLGADFLKFHELVMSIEIEFDIEIATADHESIITVRDLINYTRIKLAP